MRELKLKAYVFTTEDEVISTNDIYKNREGKWIVFGSQIDELKSFTDVEVVQSVGITDSKGNELFEGDIIEIVLENGNKHYYEVMWDEFTARYMLNNIAGPFDFSEVYWDGSEVKGNIYQNDELMQNNYNIYEE